MANVSQHGLWLLIDGAERYLPFDHFPWFRRATIAQLSDIQRPSVGHLYWPELDVDLSLDSIQNPSAFPNVSGSEPSSSAPGA